MKNRMSVAYGLIVCGCAYGTAAWWLAALYCPPPWTWLVYPLAGLATVGAIILVRNAPNGRR